MDFPQGADACVPATGSGVPTRADFVAEPSFPSRFSRDTRLPTDQPPSDPGTESTDRLRDDDLTMDFPDNAYAGTPLTVTVGGLLRTAKCSSSNFRSRPALRATTPFRQTPLRPIPDPNPRPDPGSIPGQTT